MKGLEPLRRGIGQLRQSFSENPAFWIVSGLLAASLYTCDDRTSRLNDVCGLAREAIQITTPTPADPEATLRQVEMPSSDGGYTLRELWRWQRLDGWQIEKACP